MLRDHGAMKTSKVYERLSEIWRLTQAERTHQRSGGLLFHHEIRWARQELVIAGIIQRPNMTGHGRWELSETKAIPPEQYDDETESFEEGRSRRLAITTYERNKGARKKCLDKHGFLCAVCHFDFEARYGVVGKECIHVHHLVEISTIGENYMVNAVKDLVPVCPNCHYVIHRRRPAFTIDEVKDMIAAAQPSE